MKKLFIVLSIVLSLALAGNVMAGERCEQCGPRNADLNNLQFQASGSDKDFSMTGNDFGYGEANGFAGGTLDVHANADGRFFGWIGPKWYNWGMIDNPAIADGFGIGEASGHAWSWAKDYGLTSKAGAGAKTEGESFYIGTAIGLFGCRETVQGEVYVGGNVYQHNGAGETGYYGGFVNGGNESGGGFLASDYDYDSGRGLVIDTNSIEGGMITKGKTEVTIDPYGNHRSFEGMTQNMVQVNAPNIQSSNVFGNGGVSGMVQKGGVFAGGNANFSYQGGTYGNGNAIINGSINVGPNSATAVVSGHAYSVSNGGGGFDSPQ